MIAGLDHIAIAVVDLDSAVDGYSRLLGRDAVRCDGDGAARAWFRLANMSLELVAPLGEGTSGDRVRARLASHGEGQWLMAFAVEDLAAAQRLLARRGVPSSYPAPLACPQAGRQAIALDPEATGGLQSVLVDTPAAEDATPEAAAAVTGLDHVVVNTPDPERAVATYAGRLGLDLRLTARTPPGACANCSSAPGPRWSRWSPGSTTPARAPTASAAWPGASPSPTPPAPASPRPGSMFPRCARAASPAPGCSPSGRASPPRPPS